MPTTPHELSQELVDMEVEKLIEHTLNNGEELYQFFMDNLDSLEAVCNVIVMHWNNKDAWPIIKHQIDQEVKAESYDKARERIYG